MARVPRGAWRCAPTDWHPTSSRVLHLPVDVSYSQDRPFRRARRRVCPLEIPVEAPSPAAACCPPRATAAFDCNARVAAPRWVLDAWDSAPEEGGFELSSGLVRPPASSSGDEEAEGPRSAQGSLSGGRRSAFSPILRTPSLPRGPDTVTLRGFGSLVPWRPSLRSLTPPRTIAPLRPSVLVPCRWSPSLRGASVFAQFRDWAWVPRRRGIRSLAQAVVGFGGVSYFDPLATCQGH